MGLKGEHWKKGRLGCPRLTLITGKSLNSLLADSVVILSKSLKFQTLNFLPSRNNDLILRNPKNMRQFLIYNYHQLTVVGD